MLAAIGLSTAACAVAEFDRIQASSEQRARCAADAATDVAEGCPDREPGRHAEAEDAALEAGLDAALGADMSEAGGESDGALPLLDAGAQVADSGAATSPVEGSVPDAPMCTDVISDPHNCGHCGVDCQATGARVSCENGSCNRACEDGLADCNGDLVLGGKGNGCERPIDGDALNCGACRRRCVAPSDGYAACKKQQCNAYRLVPGARSASAQQGNATGGAPFDLLCGEGQVLTGLDVVGLDIAYGIRTRCASLRVARSGTEVSVSFSPATVGSWVGGIITGPPPTYERRCPDGTLVSGVSGTLWNYPGATTVPSVKTLVLSCAEVRVSGDKVTLVPGQRVEIGQPEATPLIAFSHPCAGAAAVAGFSGRAGSYLDAIATHCATLALREEPGSAMTAAAD